MSDTEKQQKHLIEEAIQLLNEEYEASHRFNEDFDRDEPITLGKLEFQKKAKFYFGWTVKLTTMNRQHGTINLSKNNTKHV